MRTLNTYFGLQFESVKNKNSNQIDNLNTVIETNINSGKQIFDYETGKSKFLIASHAVDNTIIEDYSYHIVYTDLKLNNNYAVAYITLTYNIKYNFIQDVDNESDYHEISLVKEKGKWLICNDVYTNEFKQDFGIGTDFNKLTINAQVDYDTYSVFGTGLEEEAVQLKTCLWIVHGGQMYQPQQILGQVVHHLIRILLVMNQIMLMEYMDITQVFPM